MEANPYESPNESGSTLSNQVDRRARDKLAALIRRFLNREIGAFDFDKGLFDDLPDSTDTAVEHVRFAAWHHYDDCRDHLVNLSKPEWDYFQRLLLLLESDRVIEETKMRHWSWSQLLAVAAFGAAAYTTSQRGWGPHLWIIAGVLGIVSWIISSSRRNQDTIPYDPLLVPFDSFADLKAAYNTAPTFNKTRCARDLERRSIRSPREEWRIRVLGVPIWLAFSPFALAIQAFPATETRVRVSAP